MVERFVVYSHVQQQQQRMIILCVGMLVCERMKLFCMFRVVNPHVVRVRKWEKDYLQMFVL